MEAAPLPNTEKDVSEAGEKTIHPATPVARQSRRREKLGGEEKEENTKKKKTHTEGVQDYLSRVLITALRKSGNGKTASCSAAAPRDSPPSTALRPSLSQKSLANRDRLLRRRASVLLTQKHTGCIQTRTNVLVISLLRRRLPLPP